MVAQKLPYGGTEQPEFARPVLVLTRLWKTPIAAIAKLALEAWDSPGTRESAGPRGDSGACAPHVAALRMRADAACGWRQPTRVCPDLP